MKRINFKTTLMTGLFVLLGMVAKADNNPIVVGNSRFTFITENLVRMEYANHQKFLDDSTLFAVNRQAGNVDVKVEKKDGKYICLLYTSPSPRDGATSRMPSSA